MDGGGVKKKGYWGFEKKTEKVMYLGDEIATMSVLYVWPVPRDK